MRYEKNGNYFVIKLEKGDRLIENLAKFCEREKIKAGCLSGIGGAERLEVAYYSLKDKKYHSKIFSRPPFEILSLAGNVSISEGQVKIHAHVAFSDSEFRVYGGHLNEATVFPMCEIILMPLKKTLERKRDDETGLYMLDLPS